MTISFYLHHFQDRKGLRKIYVRVFHSGFLLFRMPVKDQIGNQMKCKEEGWVGMKKILRASKKDRLYRVKVSYPNSKYINSVLDQLEKKIEGSGVELYRKGKGLTKANILELIQDQGPGHKDIRELHKIYFEVRKEEGISKLSLRNINYSLSRVEELGARMEDINPDLYQSIRKMCIEKDLSENTFRLIIRIYKGFLNWSFEKEYIPTFSLRSWKASTLNPEKLALRIADLKKLYRVEVEESLRPAKDMLILFCMTGLRYSELISFEPETLDPQRKIMYLKKGKGRGSQKKTHAVKINPWAWEVLERNSYDIPRTPSTLSTSQINKDIKLVGKAVGIDYVVQLEGQTYHAYKVLSSHTGRRTLASIAVADLGMERALVNHITGHKAKQSELDTYIHRSKEIQAIKAMDQFYDLLLERLPFLPKKG